MLQCNFWMIHSVGEHPGWSHSLLLHFAVVHGLVITVRFGSSLDQDPVLPAVSLELPIPSKWLESAWNAWKTRFRQSIFRHCGLRALGARGWFHPVRLCKYVICYVAKTDVYVWCTVAIVNLYLLFLRIKITLFAIARGFDDEIINL